MKEFLVYILGVVVCSAVFTVFYRTAMHRHVSFRTARMYLLVSIAVAAVIPAFDIPVWSVPSIEAPFMPQITATSVTDTTAAPPTDWANVALWTLWGAGIVLLTAMTGRQTARIARIRRRAERFSTGELEIALSGEIDAPFSFLDTVFIKRGTPEDDVRQIVLHEGSHIRHRHSQEKIVAETLKILMWFNPFAWWTASLLGEVHEFEADRDVLDDGATIEEYLPLIFRQIFGYVPELSAGLGDSLTKKRFLMMKTKMKSTKFGWLRVAGVLPLAAGLVLLFSFTSRQPEIIYTEAPAAAAQEPQKDGAPEEDVKIVTFDSGTQSKGDVKIVTFDSGTLNRFYITSIEGAQTITVEDFGNFLNLKEDGKPLIILDGEQITSALMEAIDPNTLKNISVLKDASAVEVYGEAGKDGVILITSKSANTPATAATPVGEIAVVGYGTQSKDNAASKMEVFSTSFKEDGKLLIFLDGKQITSKQMEAIDPNTIKSISVLKDATSTELYGEAGKDGVILIVTKKNGDDA